MADGSEQPCNIIRECRPDLHFEYSLPGVSPNVNINVYDPSAEGGFIWSGPFAPPPAIGRPLITVDGPAIDYDQNFIPYAIVPVQAQRGGPGTASVSPLYAASRASETSGGGGGRGPGRVGVRGSGTPTDSLTANSGYISANMLSPVLLADALRALIGNDMGTPDEWCYVYNQKTGLQCPAPEDMGFVGASRTARISAEDWLGALRNFEQQVYTGPGFGNNGINTDGSFGASNFGGNGPAYAPSTGGGMAAALTGGGNNTWILVAAAVAVVVVMLRR